MAHVPAVQKTFDILEMLARSEGSKSVTELAQELDLHKGTVHATLNTLKERGYVEQDPATKRYALGVRLLELALAYRVRISLPELFEPIAQEIRRECDETVYLAILDGKDVVYIAKSRTSQALQMIHREGNRLPAHVTALGKSLLSALSDEQLEALYPDGVLPSMTPHSVSRLSDLKAELRKVRDRGFSEDRRESAEGVECVAAPVRNQEGTVIAAMSMAMPSVRVSPEKLARATELICWGAGELSRRLGHPHSG